MRETIYYRGGLPHIPQRRITAYDRWRADPIRAAGVRDHAGLLATLGEAGLAPPRPPEYEIEAQAALFVRVRARVT